MLPEKGLLAFLFALEFLDILITVNVTNVTCRGCYHFRWSETSLGSL